MKTVSDQRKQAPGRLALWFVLVLVGLCFGGLYFVGDLTKLQDAISASETQVALREVNDPDQLEQALKRYPSNKILKLVALGTKQSADFDAAIRRLLEDAEPKGFPRPTDLATSTRSDLEAIRQALKVAEANAAAYKPRSIALIKAERDKVEAAARSLNVGDKMLAKFMATVDEQHTQLMSISSQVLAARAEYYAAYDKCAALLAKEYGIYKVANGQFIFPFQPTADSYNRSAAAMGAATRRIAELEEERAKLRESQLQRWKSIIDAANWQPYGPIAARNVFGRSFLQSGPPVRD